MRPTSLDRFRSNTAERPAYEANVNNINEGSIHRLLPAKTYTFTATNSSFFSKSIFCFQILLIVASKH